MDGLSPPSATRDINKKFMAYARMSAMPRSTCVSYRNGWASTLPVGADPTYWWTADLLELRGHASKTWRPKLDQDTGSSQRKDWCGSSTFCGHLLTLCIFSSLASALEMQTSEIGANKTEHLADREF